MKGTDCNGTPTFSHLSENEIANGYAEYSNIAKFEPITVSYVLDWLGWFLYQLENAKLKVTH